jgi:dihydrofolate synthase/folylpolyglutamate synthase
VADPESYLDSLEPIGWRLGLERMHRLNALLGMPQHRFSSIHVVGTNGKSSVTRMAAALLDANGIAAGAMVSPHLERWSERILIRGAEIGPGEFAAAVSRAAEAAEVVGQALGEAVTQFEIATAAGFLALAGARVDVGVIEAGLGGRLDATNTIPSRVTVLTSVGLDHTEWLGETEEKIAAEKLAVLRDHTTLVLGRVSDPVRALAERTAAERGAEVVIAPDDPGEGLALRARGRFQRRNLALAVAAAEAYGGPLDPELVAAVAAGVSVPGRLELVAENPPTYLDAAHNVDAARALAEALPEVVGGQPSTACLAMLSDKDAAGAVAALAPVLTRAICTEIPAETLHSQGRPGASSHPAEDLAGICRDEGLEAEAEPRLGQALARSRDTAKAAGGALLVTGSHYLLAPARAALSS